MIRQTIHRSNTLLHLHVLILYNFFIGVDLQHNLLLMFVLKLLNSIKIRGSVSLIMRQRVLDFSIQIISNIMEVSFEGALHSLKIIHQFLIKARVIDPFMHGQIIWIKLTLVFCIWVINILLWFLKHSLKLLNIRLALQFNYNLIFLQVFLFFDLWFYHHFFFVDLPIVWSIKLLVLWYVILRQLIEFEWRLF